MRLSIRKGSLKRGPMLCYGSLLLSARVQMKGMVNGWDQRPREDRNYLLVRIRNRCQQVHTQIRVSISEGRRKRRNGLLPGRNSNIPAAAQTKRWYGSLCGARQNMHMLVL